MNLWQAFKMAFKSIALKKTRSFLTMLGIIIGVASVVIMVSVMQGQAKKSMEMFEKMGENKINLYLYAWDGGESVQRVMDYCLSLNTYISGITNALTLGAQMEKKMIDTEVILASVSSQNLG